MRKKKITTRSTQNALIVIGVIVVILLIYMLFSAFSITGNYWKARAEGMGFWIRYTCEETDTGAIIKDRAGAEFTSGTNSCMSYGTEKALKKYYCKSHQAMMWYSAKKMLTYKVVTCSEGCENNACVGSETPTSVTDGGRAPAALPERRVQ